MYIIIKMFVCLFSTYIYVIQEFKNQLNFYFDSFKSQ